MDEVKRHCCTNLRHAQIPNEEIQRISRLVYNYRCGKGYTDNTLETCTQWVKTQLKNQNGTCAIGQFNDGLKCKNKVKYSNCMYLRLEIAHLHPSAAGGKYDFNNLMLLCKMCNNRMSCKTLEQYKWWLLHQLNGVKFILGEIDKNAAIKNAADLLDEEGYIEPYCNDISSTDDNSSLSDESGKDLGQDIGQDIGSNLGQVKKERKQRSNQQTLKHNVLELKRIIHPSKPDFIGLILAHENKILKTNGEKVAACKFLEDSLALQGKPYRHTSAYSSLYVEMEPNKWVLLETITKTN